MNFFFIAVLHQYGYVALWAIVFIAAVGAPISGNLLLYAAGALAAIGDFNIFILFPVALSAAVLGDNLGYFIGWKFGAPLLVWLEKKKRWRLVSPDSLARGRAYFRRRAAWAVFISRFLIVVIGGPINWLAGAERYTYRKFLFWDVSGQMLGAMIPLGVGYLLGAGWEEAGNLSGTLSTLVLVSLVTLAVTIAVIRRLRTHRRIPLVEEDDLHQQKANQTDPSADPPKPEPNKAEPGVNEQVQEVGIPWSKASGRLS